MKLSVAFLSLLGVWCWVMSGGDARSLKRSVEETNYCSTSTPCGWEVYRPYVRTVEYFIQSPCECPSDRHCVRSSDDISISAYVHHCRPLDQEGDVWTSSDDR